jgi:hypothetical protein
VCGVLDRSHCAAARPFLLEANVMSKKTFRVQMVKTIYVSVWVDTEDEAAEAARENDEGFEYQGQWLHADAIVYDVNQEGA